MIRINGADVPFSGNPTRSRMTKSSFGNKGQHWKDGMECLRSSSVLDGKGNQIGKRNVNITSDQLQSIKRKTAGLLGEGR